MLRGRQDRPGPRPSPSTRRSAANLTACPHSATAWTEEKPFPPVSRRSPSSLLMRASELAARTRNELCFRFRAPGLVGSKIQLKRGCTASIPSGFASNPQVSQSEHSFLLYPLLAGDQQMRSEEHTSELQSL